MQILFSFFSILILSALLAGCAARANAQAKEINAAEQSTPATSIHLPEPATPIASTTSEIVPHDPPPSCPITRAPDVAFVPPEPYPPAPPERYENQFWYGTPELWTMLGTDGTWYALPQDKDGYSQKVFWWSQSFNVDIDPFPPFTVTIEQLDVPSSPMVVAEEATNAFADFGTAMLTGVEVPSLGCWEVTGQYKDAELIFVIWVAP